MMVLAAEFSGSETARRRFRREARALAKLRSPHVVEVFDVDVLEAPDGRPVLVTELLEGEDLGQRIERCGTCWPSACSSPERCATTTPLAWFTGTSSLPTSSSVAAMACR